MNRPRFLTTTSTYEKLETISMLDATTSFGFQVPNVESERELQINSIQQTTNDHGAANSSKHLLDHGQVIRTNHVLVTFLLLFLVE